MTLSHVNVYPTHVTRGIGYVDLHFSDGSKERYVWDTEHKRFISLTAKLLGKDNTISEDKK